DTRRARLHYAQYHFIGSIRQRGTALAAGHGPLVFVPTKAGGPHAQEPRALLKSWSCLSATTSLHLACRPLRATSVQVTDCPRSIPCSPPSSSPSCGGGAPCSGNTQRL